MLLELSQFSSSFNFDHHFLPVLPPFLLPKMCAMYDVIRQKITIICHFMTNGRNCFPENRVDGN